MAPPASVIAALADDLNTSAALTEMRALYKAREFDALRAAMAFFGFSRIVAVAGISIGGAIVSGQASGDIEIAGLQQSMVDAREDALASRDFSKLDALKTGLVAAGVEVRMSKSGINLVPGPDFDPAKLKALK